MSLAALEALIAGVKVRCEVVERDGRLVAKVSRPKRSKSAAGWCRRGWRIGGTRRTMSTTEDEARAAKRGMWRGSFMKPWVCRASSQGTHSLQGGLDLRPRRWRAGAGRLEGEVAHGSRGPIE